MKLSYNIVHKMLDYKRYGGINFMFGKIKLSRKLHTLSIEVAEKLFELLKSDTVLYSKCMNNENAVKSTGAIFAINIFRDALNRKYSENAVFVMTTTAVKTLAPDKIAEDLFMKAYLENISVYNKTFEYYRRLPNFDAIAGVTKIFLSAVIEDKEYLMSELEDTIPQTVGYKKIYNYIKNELLVMCTQF